MAKSKKQISHVHRNGVQKDGVQKDGGERVAQMHPEDGAHAAHPAGRAAPDTLPERHDAAGRGAPDTPPKRHDAAGRAAPDTLPKRRYTAACAVLGTVTAAGFAACLIFRNVWGTALFFPLLGAAATALLWCALARLCLCSDPERLLARDFTRAVRRALEIPVWAGVTALLCLLPAEIPFSVSVLLALLFFAAVPAAALMGVLSVCSAVRHLRAAHESEPAIYREGPLVLAVLLLVAELAALGWLVFYLLL